MAFSFTFDSNILVAAIDDTDVHHRLVTGLDIWNTLENAVLFDVIIQETLTVLCRRAYQRGLKLDPIITRFMEMISTFETMQLSATANYYFDEILAAMRTQKQFVSFHDYWLLFAARDLEHLTVISLDGALADVAPRGVKIVPGK